MRFSGRLSAHLTGRPASMDSRQGMTSTSICTLLPNPPPPPRERRARVAMVVEALLEDVVSPGEGFFHVPGAEGELELDVVSPLLVEQGGVLGQRLRRVAPDRQRLILDLDQPKSVLGHISVHGRPRRHRLADVADL